LFLLPGSAAAVELALSRLILPEIGHLVTELNK
jgi:molybdenum cofactor biosynthesis protein B